MHDFCLEFFIFRLQLVSLFPRRCKFVRHSPQLILTIRQLLRLAKHLRFPSKTVPIRETDRVHGIFLLGGLEHGWGSFGISGGLEQSVSLGLLLFQVRVTILINRRRLLTRRSRGRTIAEKRRIICTGSVSIGERCVSGRGVFLYLHQHCFSCLKVQFFA